jgi:hypothetical protein
MSVADMTVLRGVVYKMKEEIREQILEKHHRKVEKRRLGVFNIDIEGTVKQVGFYPR